jgi:predicted N-formylglutamate amidohydrolase
MSARPFFSLYPQCVSPLLLTCEHATRRLPSGTPCDSDARRVLRSHWGWDPGAWDITRGVARALKASAVGGKWSRLYIDLNRQVGDPTLIRTHAEGVELPWNRELSIVEVERRLQELHVPYHGEIDRLVVRRLLHGIRPLIFAVHTFTSRLGRSRREFDMGVLYTDHKELAWQMGRGLRADGFEVRYNKPYSGLEGLMYAADRHGSHHRLPCLELEVNQERLRSARYLTRVVQSLVRVLPGILDAAAE